MCSEKQQPQIIKVFCCSSPGVVFWLPALQLSETVETAGYVWLILTRTVHKTCLGHLKKGFRGSSLLLLIKAAVDCKSAYTQNSAVNLTSIYYQIRLLDVNVNVLGQSISLALSLAFFRHSPTLVCTGNLLEKATRKKSVVAFHNYTSD